MPSCITVGAALLLLLVGDACATAQEPDFIVIDGQKFSLFSNPLGQYLEESKTSSKVFETGHITTGNWRGYVATWEIRDHLLWLTRLDRPYGISDDSEPEPIPIDKIFPGEKLPIRAKWFSGTLVIPHGTMMEYVHMAYGSKFDHEIHIRVWEGLAGDPDVVDYTGLDNFRCLADYLRCPKVDSIVDTGDWIDGRILRYAGVIDSGDTFTTRGLLEVRGDSAEISVPSTNQSGRANIYWGPIYSFARFTSGTLVEVSLREDADTLINMRPLRPNESIHSKRYPYILDSLRVNR